MVNNKKKGKKTQNEVNSFKNVNKNQFSLQHFHKCLTQSIL